MWARFEDRMPRDSKVSGLKDDEFRLWISSICYAAEHQTDGYLPENVLAFCYPAGAKRLGKMAAVLTECGLWAEAPGGFTIVNYLKFNPTRSEWEADRERRSAAGKAGAAARWGIDSESDAIANANRIAPATHTDMASAIADRNGTPMPRTEPYRTDPNRTDPHHHDDDLSNVVGVAIFDEDFKRAVRAFENQSPGSITPVVRGKIEAELQEGTPVEWIESACQAAGENGGRKPWKYVEAIIRRYQAQGSNSNERRAGAGRPVSSLGPNQGGSAPFVSGLLAGDTGTMDWRNAPAFPPSPVDAVRPDPDQGVG